MTRRATICPDCPAPALRGGLLSRRDRTPQRRLSVRLSAIDAHRYNHERMGKGTKPRKKDTNAASSPAPAAGKPSALLDTRVVYCGDCLEQLQKLPPACVDLIYIDPPFNSNRNYEVFWGETKEKRERGTGNLPHVYTHLGTPLVAILEAR